MTVEMLSEIFNELWATINVVINGGHEVEERSIEQKQENTDFVEEEVITYDTSLNSEYLDRKIGQAKAELKSDKSVTLGLRYAFVIGTVLICVELYSNYIGINKIVLVVVGLFNIIMIWASFSSSKGIKLESEIEILNNRRDRLNGIRVVEGKSKHFDSLVSINISNLEEYYDLVKMSNKKSFNVSLYMSILGVILIIGGLVYSYFNTDNERITFIATAAGITIEIISGLLFYLYNKTVIQLKDYHDSLLDVQNILLSFKLIDELKDEENKSQIMKQMIEFLVRKH